MFAQLIFIVILFAGAFFFTKNVRKIARNIKLGKPLDRSDRPKERWLTMARVALGQSKMVKRPIAGILHIFVYVGFVIINIEVLEILIDGVFGTHRVFAKPMGRLYDVLIGSFEILAFLVIFGCAVFLIRRNILKLKRFWYREMTTWPRTDANLILITEIALMTAFLTMNATDFLLQGRGYGHYITAGTFPIASIWSTLFANMSSEHLVAVERFSWWFHIVFILAFLNYIPYSKHFHIFLSFPNVYYSKLEPKGQFNNMESVTREVKLMIDPSSVSPTDAAPPTGFGAKDVYDLTGKI